MTDDNELDNSSREVHFYNRFFGFAFRQQAQDQTPIFTKKKSDGINIISTKDVQSISESDYRFLLNNTHASIVCFEYLEPVDISANQSQVQRDLCLNEKKFLLVNKSMRKRMSIDHESTSETLSTDQVFNNNLNFEKLIEIWMQNDLGTEYLEIDLSNESHDEILEFAFYINFNHSTVNSRVNLIEQVWLVIHDVTASRKNLKKAIIQEEHYRNLLQQPGLILLRISLENEILFLSPHLHEILGFTSESFINEPGFIQKLIHPDDLRQYNKLIHARRTLSRNVVDLEYRIKNKNSEYHWVYERQIPKLNESNQVEYYDSLILDINEKKQLEMNLMHAQRMEIIGRLAAETAHDFNNQLTSILGNITLSMCEIDKNSSVYKNLLAAERAVLACSDMTKNLLSFGRKTDAQKSIIDFSTVLEDSVSLARRIVPSSIQLQLGIEFGFCYIAGNYTRLQQVIMNLIVNAKDALIDRPNGEINIRLISEKNIRPIWSQRYPNTKNQAYIELQIQDNGCGIKDKHKEHIFDPYFSTKSGNHSGLGLSSVYSIVKEHNGYIDIQSVEGQGTQISIILPLSENQNYPAHSEKNYELITRTDKLTVLFADDDNLIREMITTALQMNGFEVKVASNGREALSLYDKYSSIIDLVLLDYTMPFKNGREVLEEIRNSNQELPIILTSGLLNQVLINQNLESSIFLAKPYNIPELLSTINTIVAKSRKKETQQ